MNYQLLLSYLAMASFGGSGIAAVYYWYGPGAGVSWANGLVSMALAFYGAVWSVLSPIMPASWSTVLNTISQELSGGLVVYFLRVAAWIIDLGCHWTFVQQCLAGVAIIIPLAICIRIVFWILRWVLDLPFL